MGGRGPAPKPEHLRKRRNRKAGACVLIVRPDQFALKPESAKAIVLQLEDEIFTIEGLRDAKQRHWRD